MSYNAVSPMVEGQTLLYSGDDRRGTKAIKIVKKGDSLAAEPLWSNTDHGCKFSTPIIKNGLVFGLSENDSLFCLNEATGKTAWAAPITGDRQFRGYGSVVDAGSVCLLLNPTANLVVFDPTDKGFQQLASYKVGESPTMAYPVAAGNRIFVKDKNSVILWTIE
jgi:outer membrane protein assembly factor BamB